MWKSWNLTELRRTKTNVNVQWSEKGNWFEKEKWKNEKIFHRLFQFCLKRRASVKKVLVTLKSTSKSIWINHFKKDCQQIQFSERFHNEAKNGAEENSDFEDHGWEKQTGTIHNYILFPLLLCLFTIPMHGARWTGALVFYYLRNNDK